jgi:hypothetical protein
VIVTLRGDRKAGFKLGEDPTDNGAAITEALFLLAIVVCAAEYMLRRKDTALSHLFRYQVKGSANQQKWKKIAMDRKQDHLETDAASLEMADPDQHLTCCMSAASIDFSS